MNRETILVTGAAGYIGSVLTEQLVEAGYRVLALDNLSTGHRRAVHPEAEFLFGDIVDEGWVEGVFTRHKIDAVVHLAAEALIDDSITNPGKYYRVNVTGGLNLLEAMKRTGVKRMVFSSTAATFGEPEEIPLLEDSPQKPVNTYGESKLAFEKMLAWFRGSYGLSYVMFRYFNVCGASKRYGESREHETHLIPIVLQAALGQRPYLNLFGTDYPTKDGSCVRDYIHVCDIAKAHLLALKEVDRLGARSYNIGNGNGYTNREVIRAVEKVTGIPVKVVDAERRPGDPAVLVASSERIKKELGWAPDYSDLESMVKTSWEWRKEYPTGYPE